MIEVPNDNQARPSAGSVREVGRYPIDLTGPRSHTLVIQPGVGSLSIGPSHLGKKADLHVVPDARIDWTVFDIRCLCYAGGLALAAISVLYRQ